MTVDGEYMYNIYYIQQFIIVYQLINFSFIPHYPCGGVLVFGLFSGAIFMVNFL